MITDQITKIRSSIRKIRKLGVVKKQENWLREIELQLNTIETEVKAIEAKLNQSDVRRDEISDELTDLKDHLDRTDWEEE